MSGEPLFSGEQIYGLIPQRPPVVMTDSLYSADDNGAVTGLSILPDNIFVEEGCLCESGLIEHVAQSAAAFAGYKTFALGLEPKLGYIAEIRKFRISRLPAVGETLSTVLKVLGAAGGMSLLEAVTSDSKGAVACGQMKIFIKD